MPFLRAHQVSPRVFLIGGNQSPISIRDQMVRGQLLVDRALEAGFIGPDQPLVVAGGGGGGVSAALRASGLGIPTYLIERNDKLFHLQANCDTRWVDPAQYDWPVNHWDRASYPWHRRLAECALPWNADYAQNLATQWDRIDFQNEVQRSAGRLQPMMETEFLDYAYAHASAGSPSLPLVVRVSDGQRRYHLDAAMLLLAIGHGAEACRIENAAGFSFWHPDRLAQANLGLKGIVPKVLVSGAGDGGLQDFLRAATGLRSASEIYERCQIPADLAQRLHSAQVRADRALLWGDGRHHDHSVLAQLHAEFRDAANRVLRDNAVVAGLKNCLRDPFPTIHLVYKCSHFATVYALNHFLTLLIALYREQFHNEEVLCPKWHIDDIFGTNGHNCMGRPSSCYGEDHKIGLSSRPDCRTSPRRRASRMLEANVLILRLGIEPHPIVKRLQPPSLRHMLPYALPM